MVRFSFVRDARRSLLASLVFGAALLVSIHDVAASCNEVPLPNNGSTSGNARAPSVRFAFSRAVYLLRPSEMAASGLISGAITTIGWNYNTAPGLVGSAPLKIYLQNTTDTTNTKSTSWTTAITGMTLVHNATTTLPNVTGAFDITLSGGSPFTYSGSGLYVAFDWGGYTGTLSTTAVIACNNTLTNGLNGAQSNTSAPTTLAASSFRPETRLTGAVQPTDVTVAYLISMGALPIGLTAPESIQATVFQLGDLDLTDTPVTLDITGVDPMNSTVTVPSLGKCGTNGSLVTFPSFTPAVVGSDVEKVSVPTDIVPGNDSLTRNLDVTRNRYSYEHPGLAASGGVGFNSPNTGEFVAKVATTTPTQIDSVTLSFFASSATTYRAVVRADDGTGKPGATLYLDSADRSVAAAGPVTIVLPSPISFGPGTIFVGVRQTNTTNASLSYNFEYPIRSNTFFYSTTPDAGPWTDFNPNNQFQLNVGAILGSCLNSLSVSLSPPGTTQVACGANQLLSATTAGGTGPFRYQWTENGVDIAGATNSTYSPNHTSGTFSYNCKVSDAGGCLSYTASSDSVVVWGPTAAVSGGGAICAGGTAQIQAALTGSGPWDLTWSDGFVQSGVVSSPAVRNVSPASDTTYSVTVVSDANCAGTSTGSAVVIVNSPPGEVASDTLVWTSPTDLDWPSLGGAATYTLYRGTGSSIPDLANANVDSCTRYQGGSSDASGLTELPAAGDTLWYLVTGSSAAGCEGTAGPGRVVNSGGVCP